MPDQKVKIELSTSSIFKIVAVILLLWFLYLIKGILIILFVALIFVSAIDPLVSWLRRHRIPAWVSVLTIYLTLIVLISLVIILFVPLVSNQIQKFSSNFPAYWQKIDTSLSNINTILVSMD
ncbi:MAG: AI-2E family transporter [Patescibacteria group bacterium]